MDSSLPSFFDRLYFPSSNASYFPLFHAFPYPLSFGPSSQPTSPPVLPQVLSPIILEDVTPLNTSLPDIGETAGFTGAHKQIPFSHVIYAVYMYFNLRMKAS
jgi:hypothetical protein